MAWRTVTILLTPSSKSSLLNPLFTLWCMMYSPNDETGRRNTSVVQRRDSRSWKRNIWPKSWHSRQSSSLWCTAPNEWMRLRWGWIFQVDQIPTGPQLYIIHRTPYIMNHTYLHTFRFLFIIRSTPYITRTYIHSDSYTSRFLYNIRSTTYIAHTYMHSDHCFTSLSNSLNSHTHDAGGMAK